MKLTVILLFCAAATAGCNWMKKAPPPEPVEAINADTIRVYKDALDNLKTSKVRLTPFPDLLSLMGKISVTEDRTTIVPARVAGRIESIFFASGEHVQHGQVLASLFSPDFISAKEEYLLSLKQTESSGPKNGGGSYSADPSDFANLAQMSRKKLQTMGLSPEDIESLGQAGSAGDGKALLSVRAPRSGVLIQKNAALGNLVNMGDTLFVIGDLDKVWFSGDIYPEDLPKIKKNQDVFINAVGVDKPLYGKVSFISPLVDPNTRSIKIRAMMDNGNHALKADEYVQGNVVLENKSALNVPVAAVVRTPGGNVIYKRVNVTNSEQTATAVDFKKVVVSLGPEQNGMIAVTQGLAEGDDIVTDGAWLLDSALNSAQAPPAHSAEGK